MSLQFLRSYGNCHLCFKGNVDYNQTWIQEEKDKFTTTVKGRYANLVPAVPVVLLAIDDR